MLPESRWQGRVNGYDVKKTYCPIYFIFIVKKRSKNGWTLTDEGVQVCAAGVLQRETGKEQFWLQTKWKSREPFLLTPASIQCCQHSYVNAETFLLFVIRRVKYSAALSSLHISFCEQLQRQ